MSMEFLVGRTLRNNLFNLGLEKETKEYLEQNNITFNEGRRIIDRIFELGYITKRERFIILHAISDNSLCVDNKVRDKLRANILLNILYSFGRENE